jgi:ATP adenylyltransferase/5',5'''-P-1,P-4-tetraphosphate phosphorylase II
MKLTMIMSASKSDNLVLTGEDFEEAYKLLLEAEVKMSLVFRGVGKSDISSLLHRVIAFLKTNPVKEMPVWQLARAFKDDMDDFTLRRVLTTIESMKLVKVISRPGGDQTINLIDDDECD